MKMGFNCLKIFKKIINMSYLYLLSIAWIVGIHCMGKSSPFEMNMMLALMLSSVALVAIFYILKIKLIHFWISQVVVHLGLSLMMFFVAWSYADHALEQRLISRIKQPEVISALVYVNIISQLYNDEEQQRIQQNVWILNYAAQPIQVKVNLKPQQHLALGQYYVITGKVKPAHSYAVEGAFDKERWFLQDNVMGTMNAQIVENISAAQVSEQGYRYFVQQQTSWWARLKLGIEAKRWFFRQSIEQSTFQQKGLLLALLTGDESLLSKQTQTLFQRLGISHLLAISGPHVLIFAMIFCCLLQCLIQKYCPQLYLTIARPYLLVFPFLLCVALYTAFVGFEIPALRTLLTVSLCSLILLFKQSISALKVLLLSASILLWLDPFSILSAAFWLSYGACFILIRVYQTIQQQNAENQTGRQKVIFYIQVLVESQWKIFIALFPLVVFIFQKVAWIAPISNLIAIPLIGMIIVPLEVVGACLALLYQPLGTLFFSVADFTLTLLVHFLDILDQIFSENLQWFAFTPLMVAALAIAIIILFLPRGLIPKTWALLCCAPLLFPYKNQSEFQLNILDVGQGQAIFLNLPDQKMMIDTGGSFDERKFSIGQQVVIPYLKQQGVKQLDQVILSHLDQDHSGAFVVIEKELNVKQVYSNQNDGRFKHTHFQYCYAGQKWQYGNVTIDVLAPQQNSLSYVGKQQNELSCILYIQVKNAQNNQNFLIMGDAGWEAEFNLLQDYPNLKVDVLVLGHHGSQHSSAYDFLATLKPKLAIISAGFDNRYGHPHPIVLTRLKELNIPVINTIEKGSIQFQLDSQNRMQTSFARNEKLWLVR